MELTLEERNMIMNAVNEMLKKVGVTNPDLILRAHQMAIRQYVETKR